MNKDQVVELEMFIEEKFYKQKEALVGKLNEFLLAYLTMNIYAPLEAEFNRRTGHIFEKNSKGFFLFWLHFFYRYDNGLRGIEWFLAEEGNRLTSEERKMTERWAKMKPQLLQVVDQTEKIVTVIDCYTKQSFQLPKSKGNIQDVLPWVSTIGLLEQVNDSHYFNGIRALVSPKALTKVKQLIENLTAENKMDYEQVMVEYYPEILAAFHSNDLEKNHNDKEVTLYHYKYDLLDKLSVENYFENDPDFVVEQSKTDKKRFIWLSDTSVYTDNQVNGEVVVARVNATIEIKEDTLSYSSYDSDITEKFLHKLNTVEESVKLLDQRNEKKILPDNFEMQQLVANPGKGVPDYFSVYAQTMILIKPDEPLPEYNNQSLRELAQNDKDTAENWFRNMEYEVNNVVEEHFGNVDISPDFNTPRKELGLPLSPFVTGGSERVSRMIRVDMPSSQNERISLKKDSPAYDILGFTDRMVTAFYAEDIIAFYEDKTAGKAKATERKYRNTIRDIIDVLEIRGVTSWEQCDLKFFERLITEDIVRMYTYITKSYIKAILATIKSLAKWLAEHKKVMLEKEIDQLVKQYEPTMIKIAQLWESETIFQIPEETFSKEILMEKLAELDKNITTLKKGRYKVLEVEGQGVSVVNMDDNLEEKFSLNESSIPLVEEGMVFVTYIGKKETENKWESVYLEALYYHVD